jgi:EAL domain-containing protein (putative c-di-GMP-specific phosphodiesterase class I)
MPAGFIPAAEDTGLIERIGSWILLEACKQIHAWNLQFPRQPAFTVAVNISAKQFGQDALVGQVADILRISGLPPHNLKLELTESVTMGHEERTIRILRELKQLGVRLCMDDFGTGYSSLSYLRRFALDIVKIDRSFVTEMLTNSESKQIVKTILDLGSNLGMQVVAEGVETIQQVELLKSFGCDYAQGYFFSKPLAPAGIEQTLNASEADAYRLPEQSCKELSMP